MKASRGQIERAWGGTECRLVFLYGPDEAGSRDLAHKLGASLGSSERIDLTGADLRSDPARLADEAAAMSLFGDRRYIRVDPAGEEALGAVDGLLQASAAGNPVVLVAPTLRKDSKLLKLVLAHPRALVLANYAPEGAAADKLSVTIGLEFGVRMRPEAAQRIARAAVGDRALMMREIEKFALFLDASADAPVELDAAAIDALQADAAEADLSQLIEAILMGRAAEVDAQLSRLGSSGGVTVIRALLRRMLLLAQLRAEVDAGNSPDSVVEKAGAAVFWKERPAVARQLRIWDGAALREGVARLSVAEREAKSSGAIEAAVEQIAVELAARAAARAR